MADVQSTIDKLVLAHNNHHPVLEQCYVKTITTATEAPTKNAYRLALIDLIMKIDVRDIQRLASFLKDQGLLSPEDIFIAMATRAEYLPHKQAAAVDEAFVNMQFSNESFDKLRAFIRMQVQQRNDARTEGQMDF